MSSSSQPKLSARERFRVRMIMGSADVVGPVLLVVGVAALLWFAANPAQLEALLRMIFPGRRGYLYERASLMTLLGEHLVLVAVSGSAAAVVGISLGVLVTRSVGRDFLGIVRDLSSLAQTFPPVAVLALAVPALGFGFKPAVVALFVYSILPVINNTISGLEAVPPDIVEASRGMGMTPVQILLFTELPVAARVIIAGVRTSVVINIGTATIGAVVGAGGLGAIIISGLVRDNYALVFTGAVSAAVLAFSADWCFARLERSFYIARSDR